MYKLSDECNRRAYNGVRSAHFAAVEKDEKIPSRVVEQVEAEMVVNDRLEIK